MSTLLDTVGAWMDSQGWSYETKEEHNSIELIFEGDHGRWLCVAAAREEEAQLVFYSILPFAVTEERRGAAALYLLMANHGAILGCFEMDIEDGEVRYRTGIDVSDSELTAPLLRNLILANLGMTDRYVRGLVRVTEGEEPGHVIREIEAG